MQFTYPMWVVPEICTDDPASEDFENNFRNPFNVYSLQRNFCNNFQLYLYRLSLGAYFYNFLRYQIMYTASNVFTTSLQCLLLTSDRVKYFTIFFGVLYSAPSGYNK